MTKIKLSWLGWRGEADTKSRLAKLLEELSRGTIHEGAIVPVYDFGHSHRGYGNFPREVELKGEFEEAGPSDEKGGGRRIHASALTLVRGIATAIESYLTNEPTRDSEGSRIQIQHLRRLAELKASTRISLDLYPDNRNPNSESLGDYKIVSQD